RLRRPLSHHVRHVDPSTAALPAGARRSRRLHRECRAGQPDSLRSAPELLLIIANIGTAVVIFPVVKRQSEELALGYVTTRLFECMFILLGIVAVLGVVTLQQEVAGANEGSIAYTLAAIKDWTFILGPGW